MDGVGKAGELVNYAIAEHVENAGVHSGDATLLLPAQRLFVETHRKVKSTLAASVGAPYFATMSLNIWNVFFLLAQASLRNSAAPSRSRGPSTSSSSAKRTK